MQYHLLHGAISPRNHEKLCDALLSICPSGRQEYTEWTIVYAPGISPLALESRSSQVDSASNAPERYFRAQTDLTRAVIDGTVPANWLESAQWTLVIDGIAEPVGKRPVTVRNVQSTKVHGGDVFEFLTKMGHKFAFEYATIGSRFVQGPITISVFRLRKPATQHQFDSLQPIDDTDTYYVEAHGKVSNSTDQNEVQRIENAMKSMTKTLSGYVTLSPIKDNALR